MSNYPPLYVYTPATSNGLIIQMGSFNIALSGNVVFNTPFPNMCTSVQLTGIGHTATLSAAPTQNGFSYVLSGLGVTYYAAFGY